MSRASHLLPIVVVGSALLCGSGTALALGFGRVVNVSTLGQPLNFAAALRLDADESLTRECVSAEVISGESRLPPAAVRVTLEPSADGSERLVRVTTLGQIEEPVVTVTVTAGCQVRLTRSFVTLIDPPGINLAQTGNTVPATLPPQRVETAVAPVVAVVEAVAAASAASTPRSPAAPSRAAVASRPRLVATAPRAPASSPVPTSESPRTRERKAPAPRAMAARREGARLQLEAATPVRTAASAVQPGEPAAAALAALTAGALASAEAASAAAASASAAEAAQRRLVSLEENMARLREESQATQKALVQLQASLEQAQASRYSNPLVYGLALLSALFAAAVAALWWRQSHSRSVSQWWLAPTGAALPPRPVPPRRPAADTGGARLETEPAVMDDRAVVRSLDDLPVAHLQPPVPAPAPEPPRPAPPPVVLVDPPVLRRELSVEELIDLEQQADFFVVLGQDDAAIDLLMGHVRSSGGASPLPYLKLLEIYRRRGEREAYERIRERFNRRFSAYAPDWDADLMQGKTLDDYPAVLIKLQRLWDEPNRVTTMLDAALLREDGGAETFDLPAYRELLFLYSIARDLAEHPARSGAVDLLLPLDGEVPEQPIEKLTASRLHGFAATDQLTVAVDLDVTTAMPGPAPQVPGGQGFLGLIDPTRKGDGGSSFH